MLNLPRSRAVIWAAVVLIALQMHAAATLAGDADATYAQVPQPWPPVPMGYPPGPPGYAPPPAQHWPAAAPASAQPSVPAGTAATPPAAPAAALPGTRPALASTQPAPATQAVAPAPAPAALAAPPMDAPVGGSVQAPASAADGASGLTREDSAECMRCHWMETMAYRDPNTRQIVDLSIDREAYEHSVHHELACRDCHDRAYKHYPHRTSSADEGLSCVGCHEERQDDPDVSPPNLAGFDLQYQHSVHALEANTEGGEPFNCFSCHNPHAFRPLAHDTPVQQVVAANNALCLDCHTELRSPVPKGHGWLPRPQQHWAAVRCIDCHTPVEGRDLYAPSHELLGATESNQNCVECHSKGSELLAQLYVHRAELEREQEGFFAHALYNDAYIIGMSRSPLIDLLGLAIVGLTVVGVAAHGYGRYLAHKRAQTPKREEAA
ncbi:cytochrome c3 family protein [Thiohalocapsa sp. ML1]|uniref:cytochrome c3 family protein n=1 Tax=Thiohalocapsa sp. ML1 TaxID=1431688 RepID=UPI00073233E7|nr:cytochrome c3 family protein [Thiohalocapsa sp. ML1]